MTRVVSTLPTEIAPSVETTLTNGLRLLVRVDRTAPVVAIVTHVKAGYFDETDDIVGIAHVLEHMYFKGTERRGVGEISKETKAAGGYLNAGTIYDYTTYYAVLPASGLVQGLDIQADAYANSVIDAGELARELEVIIQEAKRKADTPPAVASETLYEILHDHHRIRRWRIGREPGLRALSRAQVHGFYRNFYRPGNTILVIAGDVDPDDVVSRVRSLYGSLTDAPPERVPGPIEPERREFRYRELAGDVAQTQVVIGWRTPGTLHEDTAPLDVLSTILTTGRASRLYRAVRERQLAASVISANYTPTEIGVFQVNAESPPDRALDAARAIWREIERIRDGDLVEADVERAQRVIEARWIRRLETAEGQANHLASWEALGDWRLGDRYLERALGLTAEEIVDAARRHLEPNRASVVIYRPSSSPAVAANASELRAAFDRGDLAPVAHASPPTRPSIVVSGTPRLELEDRAAGVRVYRTDRGVPILVKRKPGVPLVHAGVFVAGGASAEPAVLAGLTLLTARLQVKGTHRRDAERIAEDAEGLGGAIGITVGAESFGWTMTVPAKHLTAALELIGEVVREPTLPAAHLETERAIAIADVALLRDDMFRYPMRLAMQAAFPGHPYGTPLTGNEDTLLAIGRGDVAGWHRRAVAAAPLIVALVGDVDPDEAAAIAAIAVSGLKWKGEAPVAEARWPAAIATIVESRDKAQSALLLGFPSANRRSAGRYAARLLAGVVSGLGGRFFDELRDRQSLAYTVHAFAAERRAAGMFAAYIATSPEKEEVARAGLLAEFAKLREAPVGDAELARAREYALGTHAIRQQSGANQLSEMVDAWLLGEGLQELAEFEDRVRSVTAAEILQLARDCFDPGRRVEGVVRGTGRTV